MGRSDIDHYEGLEIWGPVDLATLLALADAGGVGLGAEATIVDVGCGRAALPLALARRSGARVVGIDKSAAALALAAEVAVKLGVADRCVWTHASIEEASVEPGSADLVIGVGGPYLRDDRDGTLALFSTWLRPGGWLLWGDGVWMQTPPPAYLEATGIPADELLDATAYLPHLVALGWQSSGTHLATRADWDHFETTIHTNHERHAAAHPEDTTIQRALERKRAWHVAQETWGRDTMGFRIDVLARAGATDDT